MKHDLEFGLCNGLSNMCETGDVNGGSYTFE